MGDKKTNINDSDVGKIDISKVKIVPAKDPSGIRKKGNSKKDNNNSLSLSGKLTFHEPIPASFNFIEKQMRKNPRMAKTLINTRFSWALTSRTNDIPNSLYLTRVSDDKTILDCLLKQNGYVFSSEELERRVKDDSEILNIYLRNNIIPISYNSSDEFVLTEINGVTLLENALNAGFEEYQIDLSKRIGRNNKIFNVVYDYFINTDEIGDNNLSIVRVLIRNLPKEKCLEFYKKHFKNLKKYLEDSILKNAILNSLDADTIKYLLDIGEIDLLKKLDVEKQILKCDDRNSVFSLLLQKGVYTIEKNYYECTRPIIMKSLIDCYDTKSLLKIIEIYGKDVLLKKDDNGSTTFDYILNHNVSFFLLNLLQVRELSHDISFARIMAKNKNGIEYLLNAESSILQSKCDGDKTILDCIMDNIKVKTDEEIVKAINAFFVSEMSKTILLYRFNNKSILEILLKSEKRRDILFSLKYSKLSDDIEVQTILKLNGVDIEKEFGFMAVKTFNTDESLKHQRDEIIKGRYSEYLKGELNNEQQKLIDNLRNTFLQDGKSDEEIVELACNAFKYLLLTNYEYAVRDLKSLINIKKINPYFVMKKFDRSCASYELLAVCNQYDIDTFNHELAHVIHDYSKLSEVSYDFSNGVLINESWFDSFLEEYSKEVLQIEDYIRKSIPKLLAEDTLAQKEVDSYKGRVENILNYAENSGNYSKDVIDYVRNSSSIEDEFKKYYTYVILKKLTLDYVYDYKSSIIDIIDALKGGIIFDEGIKLGNKGYHIGHGSEYYSKAGNSFYEIIAQYNEIIKSPFRNQALKELENIVGRDFIEMLDKINAELYVIDSNAYEDIQTEKHR